MTVSEVSNRACPPPVGSTLDRAGVVWATALEPAPSARVTTNARKTFLSTIDMVFTSV